MNNTTDQDFSTFGLILLLVFFLGISAAFSINVALEFIKDQYRRHGERRNGKLTRTVKRAEK